jgi:micrococcal nuclease
MRHLSRAAILVAILTAVACGDESGGDQNPCEAACDESCGACSGVVERAIDGDTIVLADGREIRYLYVDTPETVKPGTPVQCFGREASDYNKSLVEGKTVTLGFDVANSRCTDRFGRTLAYVCVQGADGDVWVNEDLARRGYAKKYEAAEYSYEAELDAALEEARSAVRGGWEACDW